MYHYVRKNSSNLPYLKYLHIEDFKKQLDYFEKKFGFVKKDEFLNTFKNGKIPNGVVLTFDDGLKDHYKYVLPELKKRGLWGIFYINYNPSERNKLLGPHRIHMLLGKFGGKKIFTSLTKIVLKKMIVKEYQKKFETKTYKDFKDEDSATETKRILNYYISEKYREGLVDKLMQKYYPNEKKLVKKYYLNSKEIKKMQFAGMIFGAHTVNHPVMSKLSEKAQEKEIYPCFKFLEDILDNNIRTYCHPYGGSLSFNKTTLKILKKSGSLFSLDVKPRDVSKKDIKYNKHSLPRYDCNLFPFGQIRSLV